MARAYRYAFYRIYRWALETHGESDAPQLTAVGLLTLSLFSNLVTLAVVVGAAGVPLFERGSLAKVLGVGLLLALGGLTYERLVRGGRLEALVHEFEHEAPVTIPRAGTWVLSYLIGSLAVFLAVGFLIAASRR